MRVIVNATLAAAGAAGLGVYTRSVIRELAALGVELDVFTPAPEVLPHIRTHRIARTLNPQYRLRGHIQRLVWTNLLLPWKVRRDAVLFAPSQLDAALFSPIPQVVAVHDLIPLLFRDAYPEQYYYFRFILPHILRRARAVVTVSEATREDLVANYALNRNALFVIPNGVDPCMRPRTPAETEPLLRKLGLTTFILSVGRLTRMKNPMEVLRAFARAEFAGDCVFVGSGRSEEVETLRQEAARLGVERRVRIFERMEPDELAMLYSAASVFVLLSLYEGFGLAPLEAMACGCPVIVSGVASLPEVCGPAALLVDPSNPNDAAAALRAILADGSLRERLRNLGLERARLFTWKAHAEGLLEVFRQCRL